MSVYKSGALPGSGMQALLAGNKDTALRDPGTQLVTVHSCFNCPISSCCTNSCMSIGVGSQNCVKAQAGTSEQKTEGV